jgi:hypothetical protein
MARKSLIELDVEYTLALLPPAVATVESEQQRPAITAAEENATAGAAGAAGAAGVDEAPPKLKFETAKEVVEATQATQATQVAEAAEVAASGLFEAELHRNDTNELVNAGVGELVNAGAGVSAEELADFPEGVLDESMQPLDLSRENR